MLFKFAKEAGEKFREGVSNIAEGIKDRIQGHKTEVKDLKVEEAGDGRVILKGKAKNRAEAEKAIVAAGNTPGIGEVEAHIDTSPNRLCSTPSRKATRCRRSPKSNMATP